MTLTDLSLKTCFLVTTPPRTCEDWRGGRLLVFNFALSILVATRNELGERRVDVVHALGGQASGRRHGLRLRVAVALRVRDGLFFVAGRSDAPDGAQFAELDGVLIKGVVRLAARLRTISSTNHLRL